MLSLDIEINQLIIENSIAFHRTGELLKDKPVDGIKINEEKNLQIVYGYEKKKYGAIVIKRGQFEVIEVTNEKGELIKLESYNHSEHPNRKKQDFINALKCKNLNKDQKKASALIILLSESCRSLMVLEAIIKLFSSKDFSPLSEEVWHGLEFAFKNYSKTSLYLKYKIKAGQEPWEPLIVQNYLDYIESDKFKGKVKVEKRNIEMVDEYLQEDNNFPSQPNLVTTYPYSYTLDVDRTKKFIFEFSFENNSEDACQPSTSRYVAYRILRNDKPNEAKIWDGCLSTDKEKPFHLKFNDEPHSHHKNPEDDKYHKHDKFKGIDLKGTMKLFKNFGREFIWVDLKYGHELEERFEGNILELPKD